MRVDPSNTQSPVALTQADAASPRPASKAATPASAPTETGSFAMTDQLSQLLAAVRSTPDVRPEAVVSASAKLASGEMNTPQAAKDTATALLKEDGSPDQHAP